MEHHVVRQLKILELVDYNRKSMFALMSRLMFWSQITDHLPKQDKGERRPLKNLMSRMLGLALVKQKE